MADRKITAHTALTGANFATGDLIEIVDVSDTTDAASGTNKRATTQEVQRGLVYTDWTTLGNLGSTETITAHALGLLRVYGTLDQACTITVATSANQQIGLRVTQDGTGGRAITWSGVDAWATSDGAAPSLSFRAAATIDDFYFEDINGTCTGYWLTESPIIYAVIQVTDMAGTAITVTDDIGSRFVVPAGLNGYNLVSVLGKVKGGSASGGPLLFQVRNSTQTADMLSTRLSIDDNELTSATAAAAAVIDATNDDVATGDSIVFDCDDAGDGAADGLVVILGFRRP